MMKDEWVALFLLLFLGCATAPPSPTSPTVTPPAPADKTAKMTKLDGFLPLYWDAENGKLFMRITHPGQEMIHVTSLPGGVGSNPIGLDHGEMGESQIVRFDRIGPKVLLMQPNVRYRALSSDPSERRSVDDSFAKSVLWSFTVDSEDANGVLVDATDYFLSDQHGVEQRLRDAKQGSYSADRGRSAIYLPRTKAFPRNSEVEAIVTFETHDRPGTQISDVTPTPTIVTVREHHSFVALPPPGYEPRRTDPRVGVFGIEFYDYASPFTGPIMKRWVVRHRLQKKDPSAALSDPVEPLVYYVDPGVPEPIRSALIEGASWWGRAFEAAGFRNAFQVKVLPSDADPMDIRYNMINWVHRSTRGWSYGEAVIDPRTGEIIKGNVRLGSLRIRQDAMIAAGLVPQFDELHDRALSSLDPTTSPSMMALARIRQLAAHETGHTLGLAHNMAASSYGRASVMDYPSPYVKIVDGKLDLSDAYATGVGPFDLFSIRYAYSQFAPGANEETELQRIVDEAETSNPPMLYVADQHARPVSGAHPLGSVWDIQGDPLDGLRHEIEVRRIALSQFGLRNLPSGQPLSSLEEILVPLYLHHRYQLEAAAKSIGGLEFTYAVKEEGAIVPPLVRRIVPAARQREAMRLVLSTLEPSFLELPQRIVDLIPPRADNTESGPIELFEHRTAPAFDPIGAAMASAQITLDALLDARRAARMVQQHAEVGKNPDFNEMIDDVIGVVTKRDSGMRGAITRADARLFASRLMDLANDATADPQVHADASEGLRRLAATLGDRGVTDVSELAHRHALREDIDRFLARPDAPRTPFKAPEIPPGPPIGD